MNALQRFLDIARIVSALYPTILDLVRGVEAALPEGAGKTKLDTVLATIESVWSQIENLGMKFDELRPTLVLTINALVTAFNATGIFRKRPAPPAAGAPAANG